MKQWLLLSSLFLLLTIDAFSQDNFWSKTSLDSIGILAFSQTNNTVLYAGSNGKLYKSIDNGINWINIINDWSNTYIDNIVACNDTVVLLGTSGGSNYVGVFRSSDQGLTWLKVALADTSIWTLYESKNETIYAGTGNGDIYRSTDTGLHWKKVYANTTGNGIHSFASDNESKLIAGFYQGSIARSTNDGLNWTSYSPNWNVQYIYDLLIVDDFILAATNNGIFKSTDFGENWIQLAPRLIASAVKLIFIPPSQIYSMDGNGLNGKLYLSNDKGVNWDVLNSGLPDNSYFYDMAKHVNYFFVGTDFGVFKSKEIAASPSKTNWIVYNTSNSGLPNNSITSLAKDGNGNTWIGTFGGAGISGGLVKFDATNWTVYNTSNSSLPRDYITSLAIDGNGNKWIGTLGGGLARFDETNWNVYNIYNSGLPNDNVYSLAIDGGDNILIGTMSGLARFDGINWTSYNLSNYGLTNAGVSSIAIDRNGNIWIGTGSGLARFDGINWTIYNSSNSGLPNDFVRALAIDGNGNIWVGTNGGLARFNGINWTIYNTTNSGLPNDFVGALAIDSNGNIWIATYPGLVKFDGINWNVYNYSNSGLPDYSSIFFIVIDGKGNKWIGTSGAGLAVYNEGGVVSVLDDKNNFPISFSLSQNYPNPFNPTTKIQFSIPKTDNVTLKIYNVLGQEITTLVNEEKMPGTYEVSFTSKGLSSGIYLYKLSVGSFSQTRKLTLIK